MKETILSIAGKPGLYKLVSRGKANLIVESLDETKKRMPAFATDRITSLSDVSIYSETEDVPLMDVFAAILEKESGKTSSIAYRKIESKELRKYFAEIMPEFDRERVRDHDIRKLLSWYDILVSNGMTDFKEEEEGESKKEEDNKE